MHGGEPRGNRLGASGQSVRGSVEPARSGRPARSAPAGTLRRAPPRGTCCAVEPDDTGDGLEISLSLQLPRDALSVPLARHLVQAAMFEVGVVEEDTNAVQLALSEACANVVSHAGPGDAYEVTTTIGPANCEIRVIDSGRGFDHASLTSEMAQLGAEHGRGLALMNALVDAVRFVSEPERGTVVHLVKKLRFDERARVRRLMLEPLAN